MISALKYTIALLLSASNNSLEIEIVGTVLVALDVFFMVCSMLAIVISLIMLRVQIAKFHRQLKSDEDDGDSAKSLVRVVPVSDENRKTEDENKRAIANWDTTDLEPPPPPLKVE